MSAAIDALGWLIKLNGSKLTDTLTKELIPFVQVRVRVRVSMGPQPERIT
jgi:hypothetical protein